MLVLFVDWHVVDEALLAYVYLQHHLLSFEFTDGFKGAYPPQQPEWNALYALFCKHREAITKEIVAREAGIYKSQSGVHKLVKVSNVVKKE